MHRDSRSTSLSAAALLPDFTPPGDGAGVRSDPQPPRRSASSSTSPPSIAARRRREACRGDCISADVLAGDNPVAARHVRTVPRGDPRPPAGGIVRVTTLGRHRRAGGRRSTFRSAAARDMLTPLRHLHRSPVATAGRGGGAFGDGAAARARASIPRSPRSPTSPRQADASRRLRERRGAARRRRARRPPPRRAARPTSRGDEWRALLPVPAQKSRRPTAEARRSEPKTRTALAAASRSGGARLQLDPPRVVVSRSATPTALLAAPAAVGMAAAAPPASPAVAPPPDGDRSSAGPGQRRGGGGRRLERAEPAAPSSNGIQALEAQIAKMQAEKPEDTRRWRPCRGGCARPIRGAIATSWSTSSSRRRYSASCVAVVLWFAAAAPAAARPLVRGPGQPAGACRRARRSVDLRRAGVAAGAASRPAVLSPPVAAGDAPAPLRPASTTVSPSFSGMSTRSGSLISTTQHSSIGGLEVTTVLGPEVSHSSFEAFGGSAARSRAAGEADDGGADRSRAAGRVLRRPRARTRRQLSLLEGYIDGTGKSPLPYLQLLEIHQRRDDRDALRQTSARASTNASTPTHPTGTSTCTADASLEDYPQTVALLQSLWATPLSQRCRSSTGCCSAARRARRPSTSRPIASCSFSIRWARENSDRDVETDSGSIDLSPTRSTTRRSRPARCAARGDGSHPSATRPGRGRPRRLAGGRKMQAIERPARTGPGPSGRRGAGLAGCARRVALRARRSRVERQVQRLVLLGEAQARQALVEAVGVERRQRDRRDAVLASSASGRTRRRRSR